MSLVVASSDSAAKPAAAPVLWQASCSRLCAMPLRLDYKESVCREAVLLLCMSTTIMYVGNLEWLLSRHCGTGALRHMHHARGAPLTADTTS
jgi:hypothetical protein